MVVKTMHFQNYRKRAPAPQPAADAGGPIAEVPPLPFVGDEQPACTRAMRTFEQAAIDTWPRTRTERAAAIDADRHAKRVCATCPILNGCRRYGLLTRQKWGIWGGMNLPERLDWLLRYRDDIRDIESDTMNDDDQRKKLDDINTIELFSLDAIAIQNSAPERPKRRSVRILAYGNCPCCTNMRVPIIGIGNHSAWREHFYTTWNGDTRPCRTSGVVLCQLVEEPGTEYSGAPLECRCGRTPTPDAPTPDGNAPEYDHEAAHFLRPAKNHNPPTSDDAA